ncbi:MAG: hypothetical protein CL893_00705 [Dehalococcoidia bacterium]|nr:hypothetical protein [Dehalococcoidia bacterium]
MGKALSIKKRIYFIFILCFAVFIAADDQTVIVTLLPSMVIDLSISVGELNKISWTITSYLLGFTIVMPIAGKVCDKYGFRNTLIVALLVFSFGSFLVGFTTNIPNNSFFPSKLSWLIFFRFIQSMGGGAIIPIAIASISIILEKKYWVYGFGLIGASAEAGGVIGPLWGTLILNIWDWPAAFYINLPLAFFVILLIFSLPKSSRSSVKIKLFDTLIISIALILLTILISEFNSLGFFRIIIGLILFFLILLAIIKLKFYKQDLIPQELILSKTFLLTSITHFFLGCSLIIVMVIIPLSGSTIYQLESIEVGLSLLKLTAFIGIGSILGILISKINTSLTMIIGSIFISTGIFLYINNLDIPTNQINFIFFIICTGFGLFIVPIHNAGFHNIKEDIRGITSSLISVSRMIGMIFGLSLMTTLGTARFSELVTGIQIFSTDPKIQNTINNEINDAGLEVFIEIMQGAFIFSLATLVSVLLLMYFLEIKKRNH